MAANISGTVYLSANAKYDPGDTPPGQLDQLWTSSFAFENILLAYGNGTTLLNGALQVNDWYQDSLTITAGSYAHIDLNGGSQQNPFGVTLAFTKIKLVIVGLQGQDGTLHYHIGPDAQSDPFIGWFDGTYTDTGTGLPIVVGAESFSDEYGTFIKQSGAAGWAVTATTADLLYFKNPNASNITLDIFLAGVK